MLSGDRARPVLVPDEPAEGVVGPIFKCLALLNSWILETFDLRTISEGRDTSTTEFCFDADTGFLDRSRIWTGSSPSSLDIVKDFLERIDSGFVARETTFGGDPGGIPGGETCGLTLTLSTSQNWVEHDYRFGALEKTRVVDPSNQAVILEAVDNLIDRNTGRVLRSRDSAANLGVRRFVNPANLGVRGFMSPTV